MKQTIAFLVFVALVVGLLFALSGERANRIPEDRNHAVWDRNDLCLDCHGPEGLLPRGPDHPPKDDCIKCHKVKRTRT